MLGPKDVALAVVNAPRIPGFFTFQAWGGQERNSNGINQIGLSKHDPMQV